MEENYGDLQEYKELHEQEHRDMLVLEEVRKLLTEEQYIELNDYLGEVEKKTIDIWKFDWL